MIQSKRLYVIHLVKTYPIKAAPASLTTVTTLLTVNRVRRSTFDAKAALTCCILIQRIDSTRAGQKMIPSLGNKILYHWPQRWHASRYFLPLHGLVMKQELCYGWGGVLGRFVTMPNASRKAYVYNIALMLAIDKWISRSGCGECRRQNRYWMPLHYGISLGSLRSLPIAVLWHYNCSLETLYGRFSGKYKVLFQHTESAETGEALASGLCSYSNIFITVCDLEYYLTTLYTQRLHSAFQNTYFRFEETPNKWRCIVQTTRGLQEKEDGGRTVKVQEG